MPVDVPVGLTGRGSGAEAADPGRLSPRHLAFILPLILIHPACALVLVTGVSTPAVVVFAVSAGLQVFGITAGYHRLLAHRSYKTSRAFQFVLAVLGVLAGQNGPLWWVGHHRQHHRYSDQEGDPHSPRRGFLWGHVGWLFSPSCIRVRRHIVADLARCAELVALERWCYAVNLAYALLLYGLGEAWRAWDPGSGATGLQFVVWGAILSTVYAYHAIWSANSFCHRFGFRRYKTGDDSRNNFLVSLLIFGDGWHHNHHQYPNSARHGLRWWEVDVNFAILTLLSRLGLVWDLRLPPGGRAAALTPGAREDGMPFIASNGLTEKGTGKTVAGGGMTVHYHDIGVGEPVLFLHSYGPGTTAWITFHKAIGALSQHFRCILMDMPNFSKTGPIVYREGVHGLQARTAVALLDVLGIAEAHWVGNSQGGQSSMVAAIEYPDRVRKFVMGGSHIGTGGDRYLMANRPSEGSRATLHTIADPSLENVRNYLRVHIDDESLVTDELVAYIHHAHTWSPEFLAARAQSVSLPHDYTPDLAGIKSPVLLIHGRYDRMVPFEVSIAILNHIEDSRLVLLNNCGHWPPFEKPAEWTAQVLAFLRGY